MSQRPGVTARKFGSPGGASRRSVAALADGSTRAAVDLSELGPGEFSDIGLAGATPGGDLPTSASRDRRGLSGPAGTRFRAEGLDLAAEGPSDLQAARAIELAAHAVRSGLDEEVDPVGVVVELQLAEVETCPA